MRQETLQAKLRNKVGALYSLPKMILHFEKETDEDKKRNLWNIIVEQAKTSETMNKELVDLLDKVEN